MQKTELAAERLRIMLQTIVCELVDRPDDAKITSATSEDGQIVTLTVKAADGEVGKVIGRGGCHAQSIRSLLEAVAAKFKLRVALEIADSRVRSQHGNEHPRRTRDDMRR